MLPRPTTTCFVQHWLFQPNFLPQPSSSYTGFVISSMIGYDKVGWGRRDDHHTPSYSYPVLPQPISSYTALFSILPSRTLSVILPHPTTTFFVLHCILALIHPTWCNGIIMGSLLAEVDHIPMTGFAETNHRLCILTNHSHPKAYPRFVT